MSKRIKDENITTCFGKQDIKDSRPSPSFSLITNGIALWGGLLLLVLFSLVLSFSIGSATLSLRELIINAQGEGAHIFFELRLPRALAAFVCGGLLSLAGALMQLLLHNPLADPYVLGVSAGAALVTLFMMCLGANEGWLMPGAWAGSLFSMLLVLFLARKHRFQSHTLLLTGIALSSALSALTSFILLLSPNENLHSMLFWLAGDLNGAGLPWLSLSILVVGLIICLMLAPGLNVLVRGERPARALGLSSKAYRIALYVLAALFTAASVTVAGCIGFIGLIVPHLTRMLVGFDHRIVLPVSVLLGGSLLGIADTVARSAFAPQQLPVGLVMALIGAPVFMWLLQR